MPCYISRCLGCVLFLSKPFGSYHQPARENNAGTKFHLTSRVILGAEFSVFNFTILSGMKYGTLGNDVHIEESCPICRPLARLEQM